MLIKSTRFGDLIVNDKDIINFPKGLPGFPDERGFVLIPYQEESPFAFLQSVQEAKLTFLVIDPFSFFTDYEFKLEDDLLQELKLSEENPPHVLNIVTVPDSTELMTANLLAPIIINMTDKLGMQIVLEKSNWTTRHRLFPDGLPKKNGKEGK